MYPTWWGKTEPQKGSVLFISPRSSSEQFCENISVIVEDTQFNLEDYTFKTVVQITNESGTKILQSNPTVLSGFPAHELVYTSYP